MQLFDNFGRYCGLPQPSASPHVRLEQPEVCYDSILSWVYSKFPPPNPQRPIGPLNAEQLGVRSEAFVDRLRRDERVSNVLKGVYLPLLLPQLPSRHYGSRWDYLPGRANDYGTLLRDIFLPAMMQCLWIADSRRWFANHLAPLLPHQVNIAPESRHEQLVQRMLREHVIAIFFPMALLGFSAGDCRRLIATLPKNFLLSGGFDVATAFVCYSKLLARDATAPVITMAALDWRSSPNTLATVESWQQGTVVSREANISAEHSAYAPGLLVIEDNQ